MARSATTKRTMPITEDTQKNGSESTSDTANVLDTTSHQNSMNSTLPTNVSKEHWPQPQTVRHFASQVNAVATRVLNGTIDMDIARTYATLSRVLAQAMSVEVTKARFLKQAPDLRIDDYELDEE